MARRAEKFRRLVWLKELSTDGEGLGPLVAGHTPANLEQYIALLTGGYGLWIEMEKNGDEFSLRCYPAQRLGSTNRPRICASYTGPNLARLLLVATEDYREYINHPGEAQLSPFEVVRSVK